MHIEVTVSDQTLRLREAQTVVASYTISTSKFGLGTEEGSNRTPLGNFTVYAKIGDDAPLRTIFRGRVPVGVWNPGDPTEEDLVLTRILWLDGLDPENGNTRERFIYIHGTNQEQLLGTKASHGCVRMSNADVMDLYNRVDTGIAVTIFC